MAEVRQSPYFLIKQWKLNTEYTSSKYGEDSKRWLESTHMVIQEQNVEDGGDKLEFEDSGKAFRIGAGIDFAITPHFSMGAVLHYQGNSWDLGKNEENGYPSEWNVIQAGVRFIYNF
ncbi:hypothetical protein KKF84_11830 [Myxococcota bacterium]|nr:hypothetical protein [Myxococcota bacterium]